MNLGTGANVLTCVGKKSVRAKADQRHLANIVIPEVFHGHVDAVTIAIAAEKLIQSLDETLIIAVSRHSLLMGEFSSQAINKLDTTNACAALGHSGPKNEESVNELWMQDGRSAENYAACMG